MVQEGDYIDMTDSNDGTFADIQDDTIAVLTTIYHATGESARATFIYSLRWDTSSGSAKYSKLETTSLNDYSLPVKGDVYWGENFPDLYFAPIRNLVLENLNIDIVENTGISDSVADDSEDTITVWHSDIGGNQRFKANAQLLRWSVHTFT